MVGSNCDAAPAKVGDGLIMVVSDPDIHRGGRLHLVERHGDEAVAKARAMVRNMKERGENEAADSWLGSAERSIGLCPCGSSRCST
jgi:hypothetical protein